MKFLSSLTILFFILSVFSCVEKQDEQTVGIVEEEIEYSDNETVMKGFLAYDGDIDGTRPGILVVHEWWGHNDYARKRAVMLAELGYTALAVDMYGDGKQANHPDDAGKFAMAVFTNLESAKTRFNAALELLKNHPTTDMEKTAAIGYCFGGGVVLHMARFGADLDGVVSFHGSIQTESPAEPDKVKAKILVCNGADDPFVTAEQIDAFKNEMDSAGVDYKFINYPDAVHSFTNPIADSVGQKFDMPLAYNKEGDEKSWEEMKKFFKEIFFE
jgi:dienelactone hydrolase